MIKKGMLMLLLTCVCVFVLIGCSGRPGSLKDGYYTAQAEEYSHGWKEFVTITVRGGKIISVEYNAVNESGFVKSWDNAYMHTMKAYTGTYPNEYTRNYAAQLLKKQSPNVDAISGASSSAASFQKLAAAVLEQAQKGDSSTIFVETE